jgi:hypothetical protein
MSDLYDGAGWQVVVSTPRLGGGEPFIEAYVVATADREEAAKVVQEKVGAGSSLIDFIETTPNLMAAFNLFPGHWTTIAVFN